MDYKEMLKKYWFVGLIGIVLIVFVGIYAKDSYNNKELVVGEKLIDGKYAVYSVDDQYVMADDFYDSLYKNNGLSCEFTAYQRAVLNKAYETTDEMNTIASNNAAYVYQQYGEEYIVSELQRMGYVDGTDDLINLYIDMQKRDLLVSDYLKAHEDIVKNFYDENKGKLSYHILVKVADITTSTDENGKTVYTANPTDEEKQKLADIQEALKTKTFTDVAKEFSDDGSAANGGLIGYISETNATNYYEVYSNTVFEMDEGEVSEPVTSKAGYHIIWNADYSLEDLLKDSEFISQLKNKDTTIVMKSVVDKANELGYEIIDEALNTYINSVLESEEAE